MRISSFRLTDFCKQHLEAGKHALKEPDYRLQLMVLNASLYLSLSLVLLSAVAVTLAGQLKLLFHMSLPVALLYISLIYLTRRRCFLTARLSYLFAGHLTLFYGVFLYGKEMNLNLFFLHLALYPFLLFRAREWRWIVMCSVLASVMFGCMDLDLIPTASHPLDDDTSLILRSVFTLCAYFGITIPAALLLWQSNQHYRTAVQRNRILDMDDKLAAIGRMASEAAHEIDKPLAVIRLTFENLEHVMPGSEQKAIRLRLQKAYDAISRIQGILQKLLVANHHRPALAEPLCIKRIAQVITQRTQHILHHQGIPLELSVSLVPDAFIHCHLQYVLDAVDSLIHNALEAMRGHHSPAVSLALRSQNQFFQVEVEDRGPGVSEEMSRAIFTPFFTTKEVGTGLGLSLYSARCVARQYGGDLTCDSGPGGRFCLSLPLQKLR